MSTFPIRRVDRNRAEASEALGSKPKFWFSDSGHRLLFKADDRGTGEDWAEVVASSLCELLGLPHVEYELAVEIADGRELLPGVVCETMAAAPFSLALGNELLLEFDPNYPQSQRFHVRQHTVDAVVHVLDRLELPPAVWTTKLPAKIDSAMDIFVGYVMLDAWIANQDRHHENWGALVADRIHLAPTFDHGAGMARNLTDEERRERLTTKDQNRSVSSFVRKARSAFYRLKSDTQPLGTHAAFAAFAKITKNAGPAWLERISAVTPEEIERILIQVPQTRMSPVCREFTTAVLLENQHCLLNATAS